MNHSEYTHCVLADTKRTKVLFPIQRHSALNIPVDGAADAYHEHAFCTDCVWLSIFRYCLRL